jgi:preprotein translocase subunit SecG
MLNFTQLIIGILIIFLIVPQTPTENIVLRKFLETGLFTTYSEAKSILNFITWFLICFFLILTFFLNLKF